MNRFVNSLSLKTGCVLAMVIATLPVSVSAQPQEISQPAVTPSQPSNVATPTGKDRSIASKNNSTPAVTPTTTPVVATKSLPPIEAVNIVLKLKERKVYVYQGERILATYPVAVGRKGRETPTGEWQIMETLVNPGWTNFNTGAVVPPGPKNPMGTRWIAFWTDGLDTIGFHGTPDVKSVGKAVSNGCVRMYNKDVQAMYALVKVGTIVRVINE
jgi:lipoprotein-anchoring transpeptidase ErfK/SrfK